MRTAVGVAPGCTALRAVATTASILLVACASKVWTCDDVKPSDCIAWNGKRKGRCVNTVALHANPCACAMGGNTSSSCGFRAAGPPHQERDNTCTTLQFRGGMSERREGRRGASRCSLGQLEHSLLGTAGLAWGMAQAASSWMVSLQCPAQTGLGTCDPTPPCVRQLQRTAPSTYTITADKKTGAAHHTPL